MHWYFQPFFFSSSFRACHSAYSFLVGSLCLNGGTGGAGGALRGGGELVLGGGRGTPACSKADKNVKNVSRRTGRPIISLSNFVNVSRLYFSFYSRT
jgi:hypothetical protein